jgi:CcmD family protein
VLVLLCLMLAAPALRAGQAQPPKPPANEGFVQANDLPPEEQLPAAPMVVAAYSIFFVLVFGYVWSIARRLNAVEKDMRLLEQRQPGGGGR